LACYTDLRRKYALFERSQGSQIGRKVYPEVAEELPQNGLSMKEQSMNSEEKTIRARGWFALICIFVCLALLAPNRVNVGASTAIHEENSETTSTTLSFR
jgi:hypothetical protein